ncbi:FAD/NAD(P)-binding domain-containing protein [Aspergillus ibericus CBS 121593]|uniref:FAD/NAD(P)-binding domain-containing protein n=1 Tax=Aspergillus ibericus CBS 121593 TaxID=1448316 RepID=A0A395GZ35_9EURO|nr:FAD/NAD(P)-binding domain-containing protein [Aspergillus ibericus CBS 121593]RAL00847.1 FAD/NAD(P)-binding domain-containing protein [Aspergillus ibericus CBS 121593]
MTDRTTIAIIGASFTGIPIAHALLAHFHKPSTPQNIKLILINPSPHFYWAIAAPRILTKPNAFPESQYLVPIADGFSAYSSDEFEFLLGKATAVDFASKTVTVESTTTTTTTQDIKYNYLVIASGSSTPATLGLTSNPNPNPSPSSSTSLQNKIYPFKPPLTPHLTIQSALQTAQETIAHASTIVIAGAGPIGIETAGELGDLLTKSPSRNLSVTLVSATDRLLPALKPAAGAAAESLLVSLGVKIIKGRKVVSVTSTSTPSTPNSNIKSPTTTITLDNGDTLETNIYIPTTGVLPNSSYLPPSILNERGWITVSPELQVLGLEGQGVYAAGDITHHTQKLYMKVTEMVPVVVGNLIDDISTSASTSSTHGGGGGGGGGRGNGYCGATKRKTYTEGPDVSMMVVPVGETGGTGQMFGWVPWSFLVRVAKGRDFFIGKARGVVFP